MFLAATGCRAREALLVRIEDLHLDEPIQPYVFIRGENTKTKQDRTVYLTAELVQTLKEYLKDKYRERRTQYDHRRHETIYAPFTPEQTPQDFVFYPYHHVGEAMPKPRSVYIYFDHKFTLLLDRYGREQKEYKNRHKITFHSFRRFVKTTISTLGYEAFSERFIGHTSSINATYFSETKEKEIELFRKIEPYLTFLDVAELEARQRDIATQLQDKDERLRKMEERLALIENDKIRTDIKNFEQKNEALRYALKLSRDPSNPNGRDSEAHAKIMQMTKDTYDEFLVQMVKGLKRRRGEENPVVTAEDLDKAKKGFVTYLEEQDPEFKRLNRLYQKEGRSKNPL